MSQKRRRVFNIEEKSHIIFRLQNGESNSEIAKECGIPHSTISMIWKNKDKIMAHFEQNSLKIKRLRASEHRSIEEALLQWYKEQRANNAPISGAILQQKANDIAVELGKNNFVCSSSWIQRFRVRHNIVPRKDCDGGDGGSEHVTEEWLSHTWPVLCQGYKPEEIFSADETGIFFYLTTDKTIQLQGEQCKDGKLPKTKITVLVTANMAGSRKEKLLVIGKTEYGCSESIHSLPVTYENNTRPSMTSQIFEKWLRSWDVQLKTEGSKILLLVDTCPAHPAVSDLECIKLVLLPPSVSSALQPMDQVIKALKTQYLQIIQNTDNGENGKSLNISDTILITSKAWGLVTQTTIANSFACAGFKDLSESVEGDADVPVEKPIQSSTDQDGDVPQAQFPVEPKIEIIEFIGKDDNVASCSPVTQQLVSVKVESNYTIDELNEYKNQEEQSPPTLNEAINAVTTLQNYVAFKEVFDYDDKQALIKIKLKLHNILENQLKKDADQNY